MYSVEKRRNNRDCARTQVVRRPWKSRVPRTPARVKAAVPRYAAASRIIRERELFITRAQHAFVRLFIKSAWAAAALEMEFARSHIALYI